MLQTTLFEGLATPPAPRRCRPRHAPSRRPPTAAVRASTVIDRLRFIDGRRVLTTTCGLRPVEISELARAARFGPIEVRYRIPTPDRRLAAVLEPNAPPPSLRFASLAAARRAGLVAGVVVAPLVPGVNAHEGDLRRLFAEARRAGAAFVAAEIVFSGDARREELVRALRRLHPRIAARHEVWRRTSSRPPHEERARIDALLESLRRQFDLPREAPRDVDPPGSASQRRFGFAV
jgi:DNA repair photolyase